jgi:hypothetical protein
MWSRLIKNNLLTHLASFLAGVFAAVGVNLLTEALFNERVVGHLAAIAASITLFLLASAGTAVVAWYLDEMHGQWLREGSPVGPSHVADIVREKSARATIALAATVIALAAGGYLLYLARLPSN